MDKPGQMQPINVFPEMFKKHLERSDYSLSINNFILLRNILKLAVSESHLDESEESKINETEERWTVVGKGCGCTKDKRFKTAIDSTVNFISSDGGKEVLGKVKTAYQIKTLLIDLPDPVVKFEI